MMIKRVAALVARWIIGLLLIVGGIFGFLPILGFWMIPLGFGLLLPDIFHRRRPGGRFKPGNALPSETMNDSIPEDLGALPERSGWSREELFHDGDAYFDGMIAEIEAARATILLEVYTFENDALGRRLAEALIRAARRGLAVRVMVDGIGSPDWPAVFAPALVAAGAQARVFHPRPWNFRPALERILAQRQRLLPAFHAQINRRNHRKVTIIDGRIAWLGSLNVTALTLRSVSGEAAWRECGLRLEGPEVRILTAAFRHTWSGIDAAWTRFARRDRRRDRIALFAAARHVRINTPRAMRRRHYADLLRRLRSARHRVWIETPYFVPPRRLLSVLRRTARRGVDLRIVLPREPDHLFMRWIRTSFCRRLLRDGARVFEYHPSVLHAKFMIIDEFALVGSSNLNHRSLLHDLEVDALLETPASLDNLAARFTDDIAHSDEATPASIERQAWPARVIGGLLFRLRYWM